MLYRNKDIFLGEVREGNFEQKVNGRNQTISQRGQKCV